MKFVFINLSIYSNFIIVTIRKIYKALLLVNSKKSGKMIVKQELIKRIRSYFNLNIYETKVWLALLARGIASAGEVAEISGIPRSRTYDVLESLEKRGFAIAKVGKPVKYLAVKPTIVIEKLKRNAIKNARDRVSILSNMKKTREYDELVKLHKSGLSPLKQRELGGAIRGKLNLYSHIYDMLKNAKREVMICVSYDEIKRKSRAFLNIFDRLKKQGIRLRIALNASIEEIRDVNKQFKINATRVGLNAKFFIVDREQTLFMITNSGDDDQETGIWLNSNFFSTALADLFEIALRK